jgi:hypothetical protein
MEIGVDSGGAIDDELIVAEHVILGHDGYAKVPEKISDFDRFLSSVTGRNELGTVCSSFHSGLLL